MFNRPPYTLDLTLCGFHLFLHLNKFLSGQHQRFQNDREAKLNVTQWFQTQATDFYDTEFKIWSHGMTNVSSPEVNLLENSSILALCVLINLFIKLGSDF